MSNRCLITATAIAAFSLLRLAPAGEEIGRRLSDAEADAAMDEIFTRARAITRIEAALRTEKTGIKKEGKTTVAHEKIKYEAPDRVWWLSQGESEGEAKWEDCALLLMAGGAIWDIQPRFEGEPRRIERRRSTLVAKEGQSLNLAAFLIGSDIASAKEVRDRFEVAAVLEDEGAAAASYHFTLKPKQEGAVLDLWFRVGQALPWRVKSTERRKLVLPGGGEGRYKIVEEVRDLVDVRTNLDGLPPFSVETFLVPLEKDCEIVDAENQRALAAEEVAAEMKALRAKIESERAAAPQGGEAEKRDTLP